MGSRGVYVGNNNMASPRSVSIVLLIPGTMATNVITYINKM